MKSILNFQSNKNLSNKQQYEIIRSLNLFLSQGYNLTASLKFIEQNYNLKEALSIFTMGESPIEFFSKIGFTSNSLLIINTSILSNNIIKGFDSLEKYLENSIELKNKIYESLKYPIMLIVISNVAVYFLTSFMFPQFSSMYNSMGIEISSYILFIIDFLSLLPFITLYLLVLGFLLYFIFKISTREVKYKILKKYKLINKLNKNLLSFIFASNLYNLLCLNLRLEEILEILSAQPYNYSLQFLAKDILLNLSNGSSFAQSIPINIINAELVELIKDGEVNDTLKYNMDTYIKFYMLSSKRKVKNIFLFIQPIILLFFGILIVIMYASIFLPMYKMMETI